MAKNKKPFELGDDVAEALRKLASYAAPPVKTDRPSPVPAPPEPEPPAARPSPAKGAETPRPVAAPAQPGDLLMAWYGALRPRVMCKFIWLVLLYRQAARTDGVIVIDEFARLISRKPEQVRAALNDLKKSGWITIDESKTVKGERRRIVSKTIEFAEKAKA